MINKKKLELFYLPATKLVPLENNPRLLLDKNAIDKLKTLIKAHGFQNPLQVYKERNGKYSILCGNHRFKAASELGVSEFPCIEYRGTRNKALARALSDNKSSTWTEWDIPLLKDALAELDDGSISMDMTGFDEAEIAAYFNHESELSEEGDIPPVPKKPKTKFGQIYHLGSSRLMCGDSTSQDDIKKLIGKIVPDVIVFDPPYNNEDLYAYIPLFAKHQKLVLFWDFKRFAIASHEAIKKKWPPLYEFIWDCVTSWYTPNRPLARHKACGIYGSDPYFNFDDAIIPDGKKRKSATVSNNRGKYKYTPLSGAVHIRTVEAFPTTTESGGHVHSKPLKWLTAIFKGIGGKVYLDMFGGAGSTLVCCEINGSISYTMEIDPAYCDVIVKRWEEYTGKRAKVVKK